MLRAEAFFSQDHGCKHIQTSALQCLWMTRCWQHADLAVSAIIVCASLIALSATTLASEHEAPGSF